MADAKPILVDCEDIDNFQNLKLHDYCSMFPEASDEDYENLVTSLKERGFLSSEFVTVIASEDDGFQVLDGRNRLTASLDAGVTPTFKEYVGDDPLGFVLARNLDRRHLSAGQKAALASKLATIQTGYNQYDKEKNPGVTQEEAAKLVQSNKTNIAKYKRVQDADPELAKEVEMGNITLDAAYNKVSKPNAGEGKGQKPSEAKPPEKEQKPTEKEEPGPAGSQDMTFEEQPKKGKVIKVNVDRGPWNSDNEAENKYNQIHPAILLGLGPTHFRLSKKELESLIKAATGALNKLES